MQGHYWHCWQRTYCAKLKTNFFYKDAENAVIQVIHCDDHNHEMDNRVIIAHDQFLNNVKRQLSDDPMKPVKQPYDHQVTLAHRSAAMCGDRDQSSPVPEFSFVQLQLSRTTSNNKNNKETKKFELVNRNKKKSKLRTGETLD